MLFHISELSGSLCCPGEHVRGKRRYFSDLETVVGDTCRAVSNTMREGEVEVAIGATNLLGADLRLEMQRDDVGDRRERLRKAKVASQTCERRPHWHPPAPFFWLIDEGIYLDSLGCEETDGLVLDDFFGNCVGQADSCKQNAILVGLHYERVLLSCSNRLALLRTGATAQLVHDHERILAARKC